MTTVSRLATRQFLLLWSGAFAFFFSFYLLIPTLPLYARGLGIAESAIGLIIGFFALSSMAVKPWAGWAADRYGRLPLLGGGALIFLSSPLLYGWSQTPRRPPGGADLPWCRYGAVPDLGDGCGR